MKKLTILALFCLSPLWLMSEQVQKPTGGAKFVPISVNGITIIIPAPIKFETPISQTKRFVSAYLTNNVIVMQSITSKTMINKLKTHADSEVKSYFKTIGSYHEMLYFHDLKAMVIAVSQGEEIKFYFSWSGTRWIMDRVL